MSLPYLGFLSKEDPTYIATRKLLFSRQNPYYSAGKTFNGVGYVVFMIHITGYSPISKVGLMLIPGTHGTLTAS